VQPPDPTAIALTHVLEAASPPGLVSAYLFGSHAEGRAHRDSDVDVGVLLDWGVFPTARARFEERLRLAALLATGLAQDRIDVVVLNDAPPGLGRRVVTHGRQVYRADVELDHAYRRDVQLRAADLEPFLRRARRIKLDGLRR
jgi:predicted nucleotidyltransferase